MYFDCWYSYDFLRVLNAVKIPSKNFDLQVHPNYKARGQWLGLGGNTPVYLLLLLLLLDYGPAS